MAQTTIIEDQLATWMQGLSVVTSAGANVYPWGGVDEEATFPFVTYHLISGKRLGWLRARGGVGHPVVQVSCYGLDYATAKNLANEIRLELDGYCSANDGLMGNLYIQVAIADDCWDEFQEPVNADELTQYRTCFEVCIWFSEFQQ